MGAWERTEESLCNRPNEGRLPRLHPRARRRRAAGSSSKCSRRQDIYRWCQETCEIRHTSETLLLSATVRMSLLLFEPLTERSSIRRCFAQGSGKNSLVLTRTEPGHTGDGDKLSLRQLWNLTDLPRVTPSKCSNHGGPSGKQLGRALSPGRRRIQAEEPCFWSKGPESRSNQDFMSLQRPVYTPIPFRPHHANQLAAQKCIDLLPCVLVVKHIPDPSSIPRLCPWTVGRHWRTYTKRRQNLQMRGKPLKRFYLWMMFVPTKGQSTICSNQNDLSLVISCASLCSSTFLAWPSNTFKIMLFKQFTVISSLL